MQLSTTFLSSIRPAGKSLFVFVTILALAAGVVACDGTGSGDNPSESPPSDELEAPAVPADLEAASMDGAAQLEWETVERADVFNLYRDTTSGVEAGGTPLQEGLEETSFIDETVENGTTYYYVVTAEAQEDGETAESEPSEEVEVTPFSDPPDRP